MAKQFFITLPVRDLPKAKAFYEAIGAVCNPQFSDDTGACMVMSDSFFVMLLTHAKWASFTDKPISDAHEASEFALSMSVEDRPAVDAMLDAAGAHGGKVDVSPPQDYGFMYSRGFEDLDGHVWKSLFMDMSRMPER